MNIRDKQCLNKIFNFFEKMTGIFQYLRNVSQVQNRWYKIYIYIKCIFSKLYTAI